MCAEKYPWRVDSPGVGLIRCAGLEVAGVVVRFAVGTISRALTCRIRIAVHVVDGGCMMVREKRLRRGSWFDLPTAAEAMALRLHGDIVAKQKCCVGVVRRMEIGGAPLDRCLSPKLRGSKGVPSCQPIGSTSLVGVRLSCA